MLRYIIVPFFVLGVVTGNALPPKLKRQRPHGRVVGGAEVTIQDNPWQVSLQAEGQHTCGGSIISKDTILTAAHCINGVEPPLDEVISGTARIDYMPNATRSSIKKMIVHDGAHDSSNDVALVFLNDPLTFGDTIQAVPLANEDPAAGSTVRVTGWGIINASDIFAPNWILYGVDVAIVDGEECVADYDGVETLTVDDSTVCAGLPEGGKDACGGDSGGPLTKDGILVGIVSAGFGCGLAQYPGIYASVASARQWIKDNSGV